MRVYELMDALASMPASAPVSFRRLATKEELPKSADDPSLTLVDFTIRSVEIVDSINAVTRTRVILDGWAD